MLIVILEEGRSKEGDMKKTSAVISIFVFLVWSAYCKSQKSNASVEVIDGVEFIHNTETPMYPDKTVSFV